MSIEQDKAICNEAGQAGMGAEYMTDNWQLEQLRKERDELKAHINELREHLKCAGSSSWWAEKAEELLAKTPAQSLNDRDMEVAERVREAAYIDGYYEGAGDDAWYKDHDDEGNLKSDAYVHPHLNKYTEALKQ